MTRKGYKCTKEHIKNRAMAGFGKNIPLSEDHKQKIKTTAISNNVNAGTKNGMYGKSGEKSPTWHRHRTENECIKISIKMTIRMDGKHRGEENPMFGMRGELAPRWKGGISFEPYPITFNAAFKQFIRNRYGNVCINCGKTPEENERELTCHHYDNDKNSMNCVPVCVGCNTIANGSINNGSRAFWEDWYAEILKEFYLVF